MKDKLLDALWLALTIAFIVVVAWAITRSTRADEWTATNTATANRKDATK